MQPRIKILTGTSIAPYSDTCMLLCHVDGFELNIIMHRMMSNSMHEREIKQGLTTVRGSTRAVVIYSTDFAMLLLETKVCFRAIQALPWTPPRPEGSRLRGLL